MEALWRWFPKLGCSGNDRSDQSTCPFLASQKQHDSTLIGPDHTDGTGSVFHQNPEKRTVLMSVASAV